MDEIRKYSLREICEMHNVKLVHTNINLRKVNETFIIKEFTKKEPTKIKIVLI